MPSSLRNRLALLLILANLPAAALAIGVTIKGRNTEIAQREFSIVQRAELIAMRAGLTLGIAEGVADTLAANAEVASAGPDCANHLKAALSLRPEYAGIVVADAEGRVLCEIGSTGLTTGARSSIARALSNIDTAGETIWLPESIPDDDATVPMSRGFRAPDGTARAVGIFLKREAFNAIFVPSAPLRGEARALALIRDNGIVVSEFVRGDEDWRPREPLPTGRPGDEGLSRSFETREGVPYFYAIAPVRGTLSNVVLATPMGIIAQTDWLRFLSAMAAPLLMLLLGIVAVFAGVDRLVLRWIARFRTATSTYATGDYTYRIDDLRQAPAELLELGTGINHMAQRVQERSTALEEALAAKNALLRELHHRVKNNFQMIASLLALQRRELPGDLRMLLRVPEDRVLAMAAAYKASYATGEIGHVSAMELLRDIAAQIRQSFGAGAPTIQIAANGEPVWLDLDQAVPLGLLVSEVLTAALERPDSTAPVAIEIHRPGLETVEVAIDSRDIAGSLPSQGLAGRLVAAYRMQISAAISLARADRIVIAMPLRPMEASHPGRVDLGG